MIVAMEVILLAFLIRQSDRWWFSVRRNPLACESVNTLVEIFDLQKRRANNITPVLLLLSVWLELVGWCLLLAGRGVVFCIALSLVAATKFRYLQEITHFAVHGTLAKDKKVGDILANFFFHSPLGMPTAVTRRRTHVREHHPNATLAGLDPNLATLAAAGLRRGLSWRAFIVVVVFPITITGILDTVHKYCQHVFVRGSTKGVLLRAGATGSIVAILGTLSGWAGLLWALIVPRFMIYPLLAWMSLLVEHRWFNSTQPVGVPVLDEASRCIRLYGSRRALLFLARVTWLPYGDVFHFAHSVHPGVRWNYLEALDGSRGIDITQYRSFCIGRKSALVNLYKEGARGPEYSSS